MDERNSKDGGAPKKGKSRKEEKRDKPPYGCLRGLKSANKKSIVALGKERQKQIKLCFDLIDASGGDDGDKEKDWQSTIDRKEFEATIANLGVPYVEGDGAALFDQVDTDGSNQITFDEFAQMVAGVLDADEEEFVFAKKGLEKLREEGTYNAAVEGLEVGFLVPDELRKKVEVLNPEAPKDMPGQEERRPEGRWEDGAYFSVWQQWIYEDVIEELALKEGGWVKTKGYPDAEKEKNGLVGQLGELDRETNLWEVTVKGETEPQTHKHRYLESCPEPKQKAPETPKKKEDEEAPPAETPAPEAP